MYVQTTSKLLLSGVTIPISNNIWSGSGGASFNWQGQHNSISAEFARRVNDGGGIQGPSNETLINGNYGRQLTKTITIGVGGYYTRTDALITDSTGTPSTNTASGNITISKTFRQNFSCVFGYAHDRQRQKDSTVLESGVVNHNRGWINISYSFGRPLGR
jgi:hypothetical protein